MTKDLTLKEKIFFFTSKSTFHGIPRIISAESNWPKSTLWSVCFIASSVFMVLNLVFVVSNYLEYKVNTVITIERDDLGTEFPTITICDTQICGFENYTYEKYIDYYISETYNQSGNLTMTERRNLLKTIDIKVLMKAAQYYFLEHTDKSQLNNVINSLPNASIGSILLSCQFNKEVCTADDFEVFRLSELYKCFKFNAGRFYNGSSSPYRRTFEAGKEYGLQLKLYSGIQDQCNSPWNTNNGMVIFIHNKSYNVALSSDHVDIRGGRDTSLAIDRSIVLKKPKPYSDCVKNVDPLASKPNKFIRQTADQFAEYSQASCLQLCEQDVLKRTHKCFSKYLPHSWLESLKVNECGSIIESPGNLVYYDQETYMLKNETDFCLESCRIECDSVSFGVTTSSSQFPSLSYKEALLTNAREAITKNQLTSKELETSILGVNVFYRTNMVNMIVESPAVELFILVANFGGTLGLFLGISALSLVEILEILFEMGFTFVKFLESLLI